MLREGRYAAIDVGTVTCRMLVADVFARGDGSAGMSQLAKEYAVTNLGEGVDKTRRLAPAALRRVTSAIDGFMKVLEGFDVSGNPVVDTLVMATSASRDAENADEFAALMAERGLRLAVISGDTEALMSFMGASAAHAGERVMVVDVGGGSTEVSVGAAGDAPEFFHSFDIGCRRVTERFWDGYPPSERAMQAAREWMREQLCAREEPCEQLCAREGHGLSRLASDCEIRRDDSPTDFLSCRIALQGRDPRGRPYSPLWGFSPSKMLAVAGTATSVVSIRERMEVYDSAKVDGAQVTLGQLQDIERRLASLSLPELEHVVGLDPRRGPVIAAGTMILEEVMRAASVDAFTASESDILEGMIMYNAMAEHTGTA